MINQETKNNEFTLTLKKYFIWTLLSLLIVRTVNVYSTLPSIIDNVVFSCVSLVGAGLVAVDLYQIFITKQKKWQYNPWLVAYLVIIALTSLWNIKYGVFGNIKLLIWQTIYFFIIYEVAENRAYFKEVLNGVIKILLGSWTVLLIISLVMFCIQYHYQTDFHNKVNPLRVGFVENRLFGMFADPNYTSIICVITIVCALYYLLNKALSTLKKTLFIIFIFLNLSYITLSGSRNGLINFLLIMFLLTFFLVYHSKFAKDKHGILKTVIAFLASVLVVVVSYFGMLLLKEVWAYFPQFFSTSNDMKEGAVDLSRPDVKNSSDISNLRFKIWNSAIDIFKTNWILGVSPKDIVAVAKSRLPHTFIAMRHFSTHNAYINILTSTGIVGFVTIMIFFVKSAFNALVYVFTKFKEKSDQRFYYILCIISLAVSGLFQNDMILVNTIGAVIFWLLLGNINHTMIKTDKK